MVIIGRLTAVCLFHCCDLSQYFKRLCKLVSIRKSNLKFFTVTSTKNTHRIPKNEISIAEYLTYLGVSNILQSAFTLFAKFKALT